MADPEHERCEVKKNKHNEFGLSDFEREQARIDRGERISAILMAVLVVLGSVFVGWAW